MVSPYLSVVSMLKKIPLSSNYPECKTVSNSIEYCLLSAVRPEEADKTLILALEIGAGGYWRRAYQPR